MDARLPIEPAQLAEVCRRHRIRKLSLFDMARIELELSGLLGGRKVDLRTAQDLSRYFRDEVVRSAEPQYVAG
jgi:hypothetical protein